MKRVACVDLESHGFEVSGNTLPSTSPEAQAPELKREKKKTRTKTGCLCCRKRKKKCDESYPECLGCHRNNLTCVWPVGREDNAKLTPRERRLQAEKYREANQRILDGLDVVPKAPSHPTVKNSDLIAIAGKTSTHTHRDHQGTFVISVMNHDHQHHEKKNQNLILKSPVVPHHFEISKGSLKSEANNSSSSSETEGFKKNSPQFPLSRAIAMATAANFGHLKTNDTAGSSQLSLDPYSDFSLNRFRTWIPNVNLSSDDAFLYHLFVTEYMPAISPLHSHPALSPGAICIPQVIYSPVLREIFLSCGSSFLGNKIPEFREFAVERYKKAEVLFYDLLESDQLRGDEDWLLVATMTLCLFVRASGMAPSLGIRHLTAFYKTWLRRVALKRSDVIRRPSCSLPEFLIDFSYEDHVKFDPLSDVVPVERNLVEGFIFNYSVTILMCQHTDLVSANLPSPFEIFSSGLLPDLRTPIYSDTVVPWMNNPVVGSALDPFMMAGKASWLCRVCLPLNEQDYFKCLRLRKEIDDFKPAELPSSVESAPNYLLLKNNISLSVIVVRASSILVTKMLDPKLTSASPEIQRDVQVIVDELIKISVCSTECCLPYWAILVAGSATINESQLHFFKDTNAQMAKVMNSNVAEPANRFLNRVWALNAMEPGKGFEALFDTYIMDSLVL